MVDVPTPVGSRPGSTGSDVRALLKDKRVQLAAAGVAAVGLVVLVVKRRSGADPGDATAAAGAAGTRGYVQGGADTTGTDIASFLSNWGQLQDQRMQEYLRQLPANTPAPGSGVGLGRVTSFHDNSPLNWTDSIQVGWNPVAGATGYKIRNYLNPENTWEVGATNAFQIPGLVHNGSYYWQIAPIGANGEMGDWSEYISTHTRN